MLSGDFILAAVLLVAQPYPPPAVEAALAAPLRAYAAGLELIDDREQMLPLYELWARLAGLEDAPLLGEADRFPSPETVAEWVALNRQVRDDLEGLRWLDFVHRVPLVATAIMECDRAHEAYGLLCDGRRAKNNWDRWRRQALRDLRELIGVRAFVLGELPSPVP